VLNEADQKDAGYCIATGMNTHWHDLNHRLTALGFFQAYRTFGDGNLRAWDWDYTAGLLTAEAEKVWRFFLCRGRMSRADAVNILGKTVVSALLSSGICRETKAGVSMGKCALISYQGSPFFVEISPEPRSMLTEDTKAVISSIPSPEFRSCLSLYSGSAIECLGLNHHPDREVTFLEPEADPRFLKTNWELNGCSSTMRVAGSWKLPRDASYDLVLARIPCWSLPAKFAPAMFCPGGVDGLKELNRCFRLVGPRLAEGGVFGFSCMLYGEEKFDTAWPKLTKAADAVGLKLTAICSSRQSLEPGIPTFGHLLSFLEYRTKTPMRELLETLLQHFGEHRMSHVHFVRATATVGGGSGGHSLLDLSDRYYGNWSI